MKWLLLLVWLVLSNEVLARPQSAAGTAGGAPGGAAASLPMSWLMTALPRTGIVGFFDNLGAEMANFGNAQGSGFDTVFSAFGNAIGTLLSGVLGSGAINTAFLNYNNRPPAETAPPTTPPKKGGGGDEGGGDE